MCRRTEGESHKDPFYGWFLHMYIYVAAESFNHIQALENITLYCAGWVSVVAKSDLNGHLWWIIVCKWKLGQIILLLLAQGRLRPLSPRLHAHCAHTLLLFYRLYLSRLFADSLPFFHNNPLCLRSILLFLLFLLRLSFHQHYFPNKSGLYPSRPFTAPWLSLPMASSKFQGW